AVSPDGPLAVAADRLKRLPPVRVFTRIAWPSAPWLDKILAPTFVPATGLSTFTSVHATRKRPPDRGAIVGHEDRMRGAFVAGKRRAKAPFASNTFACVTVV